MKKPSLRCKKTSTSNTSLQLIDLLFQPVLEGKKPRTYRQQARKNYLGAKPGQLGQGSTTLHIANLFSVE